MPSITLKNCSPNVIGVIVFNPLDVIRAVDAGQFLIEPGQSQKLEPAIGGTNFSIGICYDTYYRWNDPKFNNFWGVTDSYGVRGNWMKYRLFNITQENFESEVCVKEVPYCSENGEGFVVTLQNGSNINAEPFSDQHYRETSLGFLLAMLAPLMAAKEEKQVLFDGGMAVARVLRDQNVTIKDAGLLVCGLLRLYHLQQARGGYTEKLKEVAGKASGFLKEKADQAAAKIPEVGDKAGQKLGELGHQAASKIEEKGQQFGDSSTQQTTSQIASQGHQLASQAKQGVQQMGEQSKQMSKPSEQMDAMAQKGKDTVQMVSDAVCDFLKSVGMSEFLDSVTAGDLSAQQVKDILIHIMKMTGKTDFEISMLHTVLGMDEDKLLMFWWTGTQGSERFSGSTMASSSGTGGYNVSSINTGLGGMHIAAQNQPGAPISVSDPLGLQKHQTSDLSNQENVTKSNINTKM